MIMKQQYKSIAVNGIIVLCSFLLSILIAEIAFRSLLFSNLAIGSSLRKPELYSDFWYSDDYWKLLYRWQKHLPTWDWVRKGYHPKQNPHPLLGWTADFSRQNFFHNKAAELKGRRPVLLYGDSFAYGIGARAFQDILNEDKDFSEKKLSA